MHPRLDDRATAEKYDGPMADSRDSADRAPRSRRTMIDVCEIFGYRESQHFSRQLLVCTCAASFAHVKAAKVLRATSFFSTNVKSGGQK